MEPIGNTPAEFARRHRGRDAAMAKVIRDAGIKAGE
jgi:hypothetical protein